MKCVVNRVSLYGSCRQPCADASLHLCPERECPFAITHMFGFGYDDDETLQEATGITPGENEVVSFVWTLDMNTINDLRVFNDDVIVRFDNSCKCFGIRVSIYDDYVE